MAYITAAEFKDRQNDISRTADDTVIAEIIEEATLMIDGICGRSFAAGSSGARTFYPIDGYTVPVDDCYSITAVKTDTSDDGTFDTTWTASTDYETLPANGVGLNRATGWPVTKLRAVGAKTFPVWRRRSVEVTATYGWAAVPADIKGACYLIANRLFEERNTPFGTVGSADFGALPIRDQRTVTKLLAPYTRVPPQVA